MRNQCFTCLATPHGVQLNLFRWLLMTPLTINLSYTSIACFLYMLRLRHQTVKINKIIGPQTCWRRGKTIHNNTTAIHYTISQFLEVLNVLYHVGERTQFIHCVTAHLIHYQWNVWIIYNFFEGHENWLKVEQRLWNDITRWLVFCSNGSYILLYSFISMSLAYVWELR